MLPFTVLLFMLFHVTFGQFGSNNGGGFQILKPLDLGGVYTPGMPVPMDYIDFLPPVLPNGRGASLIPGFDNSMATGFGTMMNPGLNSPSMLAPGFNNFGSAMTPGFNQYDAVMNPGFNPYGSAMSPGLESFGNPGSFGNGLGSFGGVMTPGFGLYPNPGMNQQQPPQQVQSPPPQQVSNLALASIPRPPETSAMNFL